MTVPAFYICDVASRGSSEDTGSNIINAVYGLMGALPTIFAIRRKIRATKCSAEAKKAYIDKLAVRELSTFVPLIFLSAEHVSCVVRYADDAESKDFRSIDDPFCHQLFRGTSAISLQLQIIFCY